MQIMLESFYLLVCPLLNPFFYDRTKAVNRFLLIGILKEHIGVNPEEAE
jgi:hypothetical protein